MAIMDRNQEFVTAKGEWKAHTVVLVRHTTVPEGKTAKAGH